MASFDDNALFERSVVTLMRSSAYLATGSPGARVIEADGAAIVLFVSSPAREFLNNAILARGIEDVDMTLETVERTYAEHDINRFAIWVHESEADVASRLLARGYRHDESTRTMAMEKKDFVPADTTVLDLEETDSDGFWRAAEVEGLVPELQAHESAHFYVSRFEGAPAATLMSFEHEGDCGIYVVSTVAAARRRGIATALSSHALSEAFERGCTTATLQATPMAEKLYASVGFRDLGLFKELAVG